MLLNLFTCFPTRVMYYAELHFMHLKIVYLFLTVLGLHCCTGFFLVVVWLLIAMASLVGEHRL